MGGIAERFRGAVLGWLVRHELLARLLEGVEGYMVIAGAAILASLVAIAFLSPYVSPYDPNKSVGPPFHPPCPLYPMGTNQLGQDVLSRFLWGSRTSLAIAGLSTALAFAVGVPLGLISGFVGGKLDRGLSMIMDAIYAFPGLVLAIAIATMLGPGLFNIAASIAVVYIPTFFRVIRSQTFSIREQLYVEAARAIGCDSPTILRKYIFPNVIPSIVIIASLCMADAVLTAAGLSFLGVGLSPEIPDWGYDVSNGQRFLLYKAWWIITFPGIGIILLTVGFSLLGEGLDELLNPRLRER
ncbi:peptide ABC transporter permease [Candidatus Geothermarchaeota archaeon ex4572_27]|nr:MAG: peptide ABC transporter permease [Candidatus Geothermarchaeota archaeon ex4572_27]